MSLTSNIRAGRAYVEVTADTSKLGRGLAQAQAQLRAFGQTCTNVGRDLLILSGAMAAPFGFFADYKILPDSPVTAVRIVATADSDLPLVMTEVKAMGFELQAP